MLDLGTLAAHIRLDGAEETEKKLNGLGDSFSDLGKQFGGIKLPSGLQDGLNSVGESITGVYNSVKGALPEGLQKGLEGLDSAGAAAAQQLGIALPEGMGALLTAGAAVAAAVVAVGVAL